MKKLILLLILILCCSSVYGANVGREEWQSQSGLLTFMAMQYTQKHDVSLEQAYREILGSDELMNFFTSTNELYNSGVREYPA